MPVYCFLLVIICTNSISVCFQADLETDEVYAQMTLQPVTSVSVFSLLFFLKTYLDVPSVQVS